MLAAVRGVAGLLIGFAVAGVAFLVATRAALEFLGQPAFPTRIAVGATLGPLAGFCGMIVAGLIGGLPGLFAAGVGLGAAGFAGFGAALLGGSSAALAAAISTGLVVGIGVAHLASKFMRLPGGSGSPLQPAHRAPCWPGSQRGSRRSWPLARFWLRRRELLPLSSPALCCGIRAVKLVP